MVPECCLHITQQAHSTGSVNTAHSTGSVNTAHSTGNGAPILALAQHQHSTLQAQHKASASTAHSKGMGRSSWPRHSPCGGADTQHRPSTGDQEAAQVGSRIEAGLVLCKCCASGRLDQGLRQVLSCASAVQVLCKCSLGHLPALPAHQSTLLVKIACSLLTHYLSLCLPGSPLHWGMHTSMQHWLMASFWAAHAAWIGVH